MINAISVTRESKMEHKIKLEGQEVVVSIVQASKTVWIASGDFEGSIVEVKASSRGNALSRWRKVALRQGD